MTTDQVVKIMLAEQAEKIDILARALLDAGIIGGNTFIAATTGAIDGGPVDVQAHIDAAFDSLCKI